MQPHNYFYRDATYSNILHQPTHQHPASEIWAAICLPRLMILLFLFFLVFQRTAPPPVQPMNGNGWLLVIQDRYGKYNEQMDAGWIVSVTNDSVSINKHLLRWWWVFTGAVISATLMNSHPQNLFIKPRTWWVARWNPCRTTLTTGSVHCWISGADAVVKMLTEERFTANTGNWNYLLHLY